jgi:type I restriction enzyme S subunit
MSSDWISMTLGELCEKQGGRIQTGPFGSQLHNSDYVEQGAPVVMPTNIIDSRISEVGIARIRPQDVERLSQHKLNIGDIVFSRRGDVTKNALVRTNQVGWLCGTGCLKVRIGTESLASARFISYCLQHPETLEWLVRHAVGATMPNLNTNILSRVPINLPSLTTQHKIVTILDSISGTIETLQHQNTALESIAQTLFRSWFVNFDPVHAKAAGNAPEAMSAELAELFPSEFEESEQGLIPKGWKVGKLSQICHLNPESWSTKNQPQLINYIDLSGLKENIFSETTEYSFLEAPSRARRVLRKGDSIYGTVRPGNLSYGFIGADEPGLTGSTGFAVLRSIKEIGVEFVYCAMTLKKNIERLTNLAEGAAYPAVRPDIVHAQEVVVPCDVVMQNFHRINAPLFALLSNNRALVGYLSSLRDHLLPRLISGKLSIGEAEKAVAELLPEPVEAI